MNTKSLNHLGRHPKPIQDILPFLTNGDEVLGFIAGGYALSYMLGKEDGYTDIDIFPVSEDAAHRLIDAFNDFGFTTRHISALAVTMVHASERNPDSDYYGYYPTVQIIHYDEDLPLNTPLRLLAYFDLTVTQAVLLQSSSGEYDTVITTEEAYEDAKRGVVRISRMGNPFVRLRRILKYKQKGYKVYNETIIQLMQAIRDFPQDQWDETIHRANREDKEAAEIMDDELWFRDGLHTIPEELITLLFARTL